ncbi:hypothetical protein [Bacillus pumilus]|jgi:hypothetical protein|uniref:hypothetical protein n=1 Tax=Bacillus pumilus TaxID=1408 RepID=UPI00227ED637|nr:hypothetical protein [Bacillus pumilus]MCY7501418.1 hypothetical protein [Bacillus pumilus]MCY7527543.1 hypothetical protein [Bacillus pumilus]MED4440718.1 hypothetical protein [Bacillus pumilus]MED4489280.1 hypothetical protein [Bacillus pumilus]
MTNNPWIKDWFKKCEELEIKPWEWDFKQSYIKESIKVTSPIRLILEYKIGKLKEVGSFNTSGKIGRKQIAIKSLLHF